MLSEKQLLANRQNALRSTGPKTAAGKAVASQNAVKHGLRAEHTVIPGETPEEFDQFRQLLLDDLAPVGAMEVFLADRIVAGFWKLRRAGRIETEMITSLHDRFISDRRRCQHQIHLQLAAEIRERRRQQAIQNLSEPDDFEKIRAEWNSSEYARMIRENCWPTTPGHPSPDEAMKNFIADRTLKLRRKRKQAQDAKIDQQVDTETAALEAPAETSAKPTVIGPVMEEDITGSNLLARFRVYEGQIERSLYKALTELQKFQILRSGQWSPEPPDA